MAEAKRDGAVRAFGIGPALEGPAARPGPENTPTLSTLELLVGAVRLVHHWGRISTNGQELAEVFDSEIEAGTALEAIAQEKRRQGYRDL